MAVKDKNTTLLYVIAALVGVNTLMLGCICMKLCCGGGLSFCPYSKKGSGKICPFSQKGSWKGSMKGSDSGSMMQQKGS